MFLFSVNWRCRERLGSDCKATCITNRVTGSPVRIDNSYNLHTHAPDIIITKTRNIEYSTIEEGIQERLTNRIIISKIVSSIKEIDENLTYISESR